MSYLVADLDDVGSESPGYVLCGAEAVGEDVGGEVAAVGTGECECCADVAEGS